MVNILINNFHDEPGNENSTIFFVSRDFSTRYKILDKLYWDLS